MVEQQSDSETVTSDPPRVSWLRVGIAVAVSAVLGFGALVLIPPLLEPAEPYGAGSVTLAGVTTQVQVCESIEHGVELHDGDRGALLYVAHVGPEDMYIESDVDLPTFDGTYLVQPAPDGDRWSERAAVSVEGRTWTVDGVFEDGSAVNATYEDGGWCRGADPNVLGR